MLETAARADVPSGSVYWPTTSIPGTLYLVPSEDGRSLIKSMARSMLATPMFASWMAFLVAASGGFGAGFRICSSRISFIWRSKSAFAPPLERFAIAICASAMRKALES